VVVCGQVVVQDGRLLPDPPAVRPGRESRI
jgi:hypothetical protein